MAKQRPAPVPNSHPSFLGSRDLQGIPGESFFGAQSLLLSSPVPPGGGRAGRMRHSAPSIMTQQRPPPRAPRS